MKEFTLNDTHRALLSGAADAIVAHNVHYELDLSPLDTTSETLEPKIRDAAVKYLTTEVQRRSRNQLTIRVADSALFAKRMLEPYIPLVVCRYDTPVGAVVTELTEDMILLWIGPKEQGFMLGVERQTPEAVAERREYLAGLAAQTEQRALAQAKLEQLIGFVSAYLLRVATSRNPGKFTEVEDVIGANPDMLALSVASEILGIDIAYACKIATNALSFTDGRVTE